MNLSDKQKHVATLGHTRKWSDLWVFSEGEDYLDQQTGELTKKHSLSINQTGVALTLSQVIMQNKQSLADLQIGSLSDIKG